MSVSCLIDTNVLIDFLSQPSDSDFNERVLAALASQSAISIVTLLNCWDGSGTRNRAAGMLPVC